MDKRVTVDKTSKERHCIFVLEKQVDDVVRHLKPEEIETIVRDAISSGSENHAEIALSKNAVVSEIQSRLDAVA